MIKNTFINLICISIVIAFAADNNIHTVFKVKKLKSVLKVSQNLYDISASKNYFALIEYLDRNSSQLRLHTLRGDEIWLKKFERIARVSISENSDKILVMLNSTPYDDCKCTCLDLSGNELWTVTTTQPGLTHSPNGKYAITTRHSEDEMKGKFQIYDMNTGTELPVNIPKEFGHFLHAKFINNNQIALIMTSVKSEKVKIKPSKELIEKYEKIEDEQDFKDMTRLRRKNLEKSYYLKPGEGDIKYVLYDILKAGVELSKELRLEKSERPIVDPLKHNRLNSSPSGDFISIIYTSYLDNNDDHYIWILDKSGNTHLKIEHLNTINDVRFIDQNYLAIMEWDGTENKMIVYNLESKAKMFERVIHRCRMFKDIHIEQNELIVQTGGPQYNPKHSHFYKLNLISGEAIIPESATKNLMLIKGNKDWRLILDKSEDMLKFVVIN